MKILIYSVLFFFLSGFFVFVLFYVFMVFEVGFVVYYFFNDCDVCDDFGNGFYGWMYGSMSCWCGIEGSGLLFDGVDDFVEFEGLVNCYFNILDFMVSFYFKLE